MGVQISITRTGHKRDVDSDSHRQTLSGEHDLPYRRGGRQRPVGRPYSSASSQLSAFDAAQPPNPLLRDAASDHSAVRRVPSPADYPEVFEPLSATRLCDRRPQAFREAIATVPSLCSVDVPIRRPASPAPLVDFFDEGGYLMPGPYDDNVDDDADAAAAETPTELPCSQQPLRRCKGCGDMQRERLSRLLAMRLQAPPAAASRSGTPGAVAAKKRSGCNFLHRRRSDEETRERLSELEREGWAISSRNTSVPQRQRPTTRDFIEHMSDDDENVRQRSSRRFLLCRQLSRLNPFHKKTTAPERTSSPYSRLSPSPPSTSFMTPRNHSRTATPQTQNSDQQQRRVAQPSTESLSGLSGFTHTSTVVLVSAADFEAARANSSQPTGSITLPAITLAPNGLDSLSTENSPLDRYLGKQPRRATPMKLQLLLDQQRRANRVLPDVPGLMDMELNTAGVLQPEYYRAIGRIR